jgi:hypothetical protein
MEEEETIETLREAMDGLFGIVQTHSVILARILATLKHVGIEVGIDLLSDTTKH